MSDHTLTMEAQDTIVEAIEAEIELDSFPGDELDEEAAADVSVERSSEPVQEVLSLKEAALVLGKSIRALERSLSGKWGNRLPDGWTATKKSIAGNELWQIYPPLGFKCDHILKAVRRNSNGSSNERSKEFVTAGISPEHLLRPIRARFEPSASVVTGQLPKLLQELSNAHRELAEERRMHMEDLRTLFELQSSMRLLEVNAGETAKLRTELIEAQKDLIGLRNHYKEFLALPWWKRLFRKTN